LSPFLVISWSGMEIWGHPYWFYIVGFPKIHPRFPPQLSGKKSVHLSLGHFLYPPEELRLRDLHGPVEVDGEHEFLIPCMPFGLHCLELQQVAEIPDQCLSAKAARTRITTSSQLPISFW